MTTPDAECCAPFLKALADKTRWHIVQELLSAPATVNELVERLQVSQYNVSKHLRVLRESGIVATEKRGKHVHCQIAPDFQRRVAKNRNQLDLGCCVFRFERNAGAVDASGEDNPRKRAALSGARREPLPERIASSPQPSPPQSFGGEGVGGQDGFGAQRAKLVSGKSLPASEGSETNRKRAVGRRGGSG